MLKNQHQQMGGNSVVSDEQICITDIQKTRSRIIEITFGRIKINKER